MQRKPLLLSARTKPVSVPVTDMGAGGSQWAQLSISGERKKLRCAECTRPIPDDSTHLMCERCSGDGSGGELAETRPHAEAANAVKATSGAPASAEATATAAAAAAEAAATTAAAAAAVTATAAAAAAAAAAVRERERDAAVTTAAPQDYESRKRSRSRSSSRSGSSSSSSSSSSDSESRRRREKKQKKRRRDREARKEERRHKEKRRERKEKKERKHKEKKEKRGSKHSSKHEPRDRDRRGHERSIITGKRIKLSEGERADAEGEARRERLREQLNGDEGGVTALQREPPPARTELEELQHRARFDPSLMRELMEKGHEAQRAKAAKRGKAPESAARRQYYADLLAERRDQNR